MTDEGRPPCAEEAAAAAAAKCGTGGAALTSAASFYMQHAAAQAASGADPGTPSVSTGKILARVGHASVLEALGMPGQPDLGIARAGPVSEPAADAEPKWWSAQFTLATKAYLARGRDGYTSLAEAEVLIDDENGPLLPNVLRTHLTALQALNGIKPAKHHTDRRRALAAMRRYARRFRSLRRASVQDMAAGPKPSRETETPRDDDSDTGTITSGKSSSESIIVSADSLKQICLQSRPSATSLADTAMDAAASASAGIESAASGPGDAEAVDASSTAGASAFAVAAPAQARLRARHSSSDGMKPSLRIHARRRSIAMETSREDGQLPTLERTKVPAGCSVPFVFMAKTHSRISQVGPAPSS
jgi:hypothetical protein